MMPGRMTPYSGTQMSTVDHPSAKPAPHAHGHRWFAALYDPLTYWTERRLLGPLRASIAGGATGRVLEVGAGTGANFPYYQNAQTVVATEPDPFMLRRARRRAQDLGLAIELCQCPA